MKKRAFSLAEVLVALLLIALLAGAVYSFMWNVIADRERVNVYAARQIGATRLFSLIESDLLTCVARSDSGGAGVKGDATTLSVCKRAVRLDSDRAGALADATESRYRFDEGAGRIEAARDGGGFEGLAGDVRRLRLRYRVGEEWVLSFDSGASGRVPSAVEVAVWFGAPGPAEEFATTVSAGDDEKKEESNKEDSESKKEGELLPPPDRVTVIAVPDAPLEPAREEAP